MIPIKDKYNDINSTVLQILIQILSDAKFIIFWLRFFDTRRDTILKSLS